VENQKKCDLYYKNSPNYLVKCRRNFKEEIDKLSYACGDIITDDIGVVSTSPQYLNKLLKDVPSITYINPRKKYVLQDISPSEVDSIYTVKLNPYLNLTGNGVLVGMIDTGIDYLNAEFIRDDDTSRILTIWDQTIESEPKESLYVGRSYSNEEINNAISAYKNKEDPYKIVPSKDEVGHGTEMAGIIGAQGINKAVQGVAPNCEFVIVKLLESINFKNELLENDIEYTPIYNDSEILAALNYLKNFSLKEGKPMVIYIGVGTTEGSHDGLSLLSRYITSIGTINGIALVAGVGNEGASKGHTSGNIKTVNDTASIELKIPKEIKKLSFNIWIFKPNKMSLNVISPNGEQSNFIRAKHDKEESFVYFSYQTQVNIKYSIPEYFTGHEVINVTFNNIKVGIWTLLLRGDYITNGKYHIWLPPHQTLPPNTEFLKPDPYITLTIPATTRNISPVAYCGINNNLLPTSGKGFNSNDVSISPGIATVGENVLTTTVSGGVKTVSGSSVATAIVTGVSALLLQWGIVDGNNKVMYSIKIAVYLIYGARRNGFLASYPNKDIGYGFLDLVGTFNLISTSYRINLTLDNNLTQCYHEKLFIRIPKEIMEDLKWKAV